jgi:mRNA interferase RelE/StbE
MKQVLWTLSARRQFRRLPEKVQASVTAKLARYSETGAGDVKHLVGRPGARLRVGDFRVIFVEDATTIEAREVDNRAKIYR